MASAAPTPGPEPDCEGSPTASPRSTDASPSSPGRTAGRASAPRSHSQPSLLRRVSGMSALPTGTVTFLIADIEASTRLVQEAGTEQYTELLATTRSILRQAAIDCGGVEVDAIGDEQLAVFADAVGAVEAALATQRTMQAYDWPTERPVRVRLGLHTGTPQLTDEGYVGIDIIRASRIALVGSRRRDPALVDDCGVRYRLRDTRSRLAPARGAQRARAHPPAPRRRPAARLPAASQHRVTTRRRAAVS